MSTPARAIVGLAAAVALAGCDPQPVSTWYSPITFQPGPERPLSSVAVLYRSSHLGLDGQELAAPIVAVEPRRYSVSARHFFPKAGERSIQGLVELKAGHTYKIRSNYCVMFCGTGSSRAGALWLEDATTGEIVLGSKKLS